MLIVTMCFGTGSFSQWALQAGHLPIVSLPWGKTGVSLLLGQINFCNCRRVSCVIAVTCHACRIEEKADDKLKLLFEFAIYYVSVSPFLSCVFCL